jgi:hypothetical protein
VPAALIAGVQYFAIVFAAGFVLGTLRMTVFVPRIGELAAVALEVPAMLAISWLVCARIVRARRVPRNAAARLAMGGLALALLLGAEWALGFALSGRGAGEQLAAWLAPAGLLGLGAQLAFALVPLAQARRGRAR